MVRNEKNITYTCKQVNTCALKFICIYIILIACFVHNTVDKFSKVCSTKMIILLQYFLHMNELRHHWNIHVLHKGQVMPWYRDNRKLNRNQIYIYLSMICIWLHDVLLKFIIPMMKEKRYLELLEKSEASFKILHWMMYRRFSWFCVRDHDVKHEISGVDLRSCMINYLSTVHAFFLA